MKIWEVKLSLILLDDLVTYDSKFTITEYSGAYKTLQNGYMLGNDRLVLSYIPKNYEVISPTKNLIFISKGFTTEPNELSLRGIELDMKHLLYNYILEEQERYQKDVDNKIKGLLTCKRIKI